MEKRLGGSYIAEEFVLHANALECWESKLKLISFETPFGPTETLLDIHATKNIQIFTKGHVAKCSYHHYFS